MMSEAAAAPANESADLLLLAATALFRDFSWSKKMLFYSGLKKKIQISSTPKRIIAKPIG